MQEIVTAVRVVKPYIVEVRFEDGQHRIVDVEPFLDGPVFAPLRDPALFAQVIVDPELDTIVWPTGADLAPEFLYYGKAGPPPGYYDEEIINDVVGAHQAERWLQSGKGSVPRISEFYGIVIYMFHREHRPPHFHAVYGEFEATIEIESLQVLTGQLPVRAQRLVAEWATRHQSELADNWQRAELREPLARIEPLD